MAPEVRPMRWEDPGSTALVVDVPEAEPLVGGFRRRYTPSGADGMLAHVTLVAPFVPMQRLDHVQLQELETALEPFTAFRFALTGCRRFGDRTLYLTPEPGESFAAIRRAVLPAGEGAFVPHLTVAQSDRPEVLADIERELRPRLPVEAEAREIQLLERDAHRRWSAHTTFELG